MGAENLSAQGRYQEFNNKLFDAPGWTIYNIDEKKKERKRKMVSGQTNWSSIIEYVGEDRVREFANGSISAREFYDDVTYSDVASEVRSLLRERGATYARRLARKALSRR